MVLPESPDGEKQAVVTAKTATGLPVSPQAILFLLVIAGVAASAITSTIYVAWLWWHDQAPLTITMAPVSQAADASPEVNVQAAAVPLQVMRERPLASASREDAEALEVILRSDVAPKPLSFAAPFIAEETVEEKVPVIEVIDEVVVSPPEPVVVVTKADPSRLEKIALLEARDLMFEGERQAAKLRLFRFNDLHPGSETVPLVLGGWLLEDRDWHGVVELLAEVGLASDTQLRLVKAKALLSLARLSEAVSLLDHEMPPVTDAPGYHALLAAAMQQSGDHTGAVERYADLLRHNRREGAWWGGLAISQEQQGESAGALVAYRQAMALTNTPPALRRYAAERVLGLGGESLQASPGVRVVSGHTYPETTR